jgi:sensor histidine kinase YesM
MLIQPFIENAIWHGASENGIMRVDIRFVQRDNKLLCIVEDNGIGIRASFENKKNDLFKHNSIGISNVKQRIELLNEKYDLDSKVTIEDKSELPWYDESGTLVTLYLSIKTDSL